MLKKNLFISLLSIIFFTELLATEQNYSNKVSDFSFSEIMKLAETEVQKPYKKREIRIPKNIANLTYSQYNLMRYNIDYDLWGKEDLPFRVSFFPLGMHLYSTPVDIYEVVSENIVKPVPFSPDFFSYEEQVQFIKKEMPLDAGYAGFKLRYKAEDSKYPDEFCSLSWRLLFSHSFRREFLWTIKSRNSHRYRIGESSRRVSYI